MNLLPESFAIPLRLIANRSGTTLLIYFGTPRNAFISLKDFYRGPNMVNEVAAEAEAQIARAKYNGESKQ